jgi:hypothetical protein
MRMQCVELSARLTADGVVIWRASGARVKHPPPETFSRLVQRALWHAHDIVETHAKTRTERRAPRRRTAAAVRAMGSVVVAGMRRVRKLATQRRELDIPLYECPVIALLIVAFGMLELLFLPFAVMRSQMPRWAR